MVQAVVIYMPFIRTWDFPLSCPCKQGPGKHPVLKFGRRGGGQKLQPYLHTDGVCPFPQPDAEGVPSRK